MNHFLHIFGGKPLRGNVTVSGSKNGALPVLAACLLIPGECRLRNVPHIQDVETMLALLRSCGAQAEWQAAGEVVIDARDLVNNHVSSELAGKMRASHYLIAPLVARLGEACLPLPGGCNLGSRPMGYILEALTPLGISAREEGERLLIGGGPAKGGRVALDPVYRSPGATFAAVMAACLAKGDTVIENASGEPDVVSFCGFLNLAGAYILGAGSPTLRIQGVGQLRGVEHRILGDRLEAGTFLLAGASSRGEVTTLGLKPEHLRGFAESLEECGVEIIPQSDGIRARCSRRPRGVDIRTVPFPGFPTDLQPPMMALLAGAEGNSRIEETIFDGRLGHVEQLGRMGADIEIEGRQALIRGVEGLKGAEVEALNIRAALVVAAVGAEGETCLRGREHIARGYERIEEKLASLGAQIRTTSACPL